MEGVKLWWQKMQIPVPHSNNQIKSNQPGLVKLVRKKIVIKNNCVQHNHIFLGKNVLSDLVGEKWKRSKSQLPNYLGN